MFLKSINYFGQILGIIVIADVAILMCMILSIMAGDHSVQHIPMWDAQLRFVVSLISK